MKRFLKKILTNSSVAAPDLPTRITMTRVTSERARLFEGQEVYIELIPDSYEINAFTLDHMDDERLAARSHNYAVARYIMRYGHAIGYLYSYDLSSITIDMRYR